MEQNGYQIKMDHIHLKQVDFIFQIKYYKYKCVFNLMSHHLKFLYTKSKKMKSKL